MPPEPTSNTASLLLLGACEQLGSGENSRDVNLIRAHRELYIPRAVTLRNSAFSPQIV
jgi:hypothetical protein